MNTQNAAPVTSVGCCGGPAPSGVAACCVKDADAKASGEAGCGCASAAPSGGSEATGPAAACCGTSKAESEAPGLGINPLDDAPWPVAVIGAGPVGLAAAARLIERGIEPAAARSRRFGRREPA